MKMLKNLSILMLVLVSVAATSVAGQTTSPNMGLSSLPRPVMNPQLVVTLVPLPSSPSRDIEAVLAEIDTESKARIIRMEADLMGKPTPTPTPNPAIPEILGNPVLLATILAKLQSETARANSLESTAADLVASREEWKKIADKEKLRGDTLEVANANRQDESKELRISRDLLRTSVDEYKAEVKDLRRDLERAKSAQKWYGFGGAALGFGVCRATVKLSP